MTTLTKAKTVFLGFAISKKSDWESWHQETLDSWADLAGAVDEAPREAAKKGFLDLVKDSTKKFSDWTTDEVKTHNFREWSKDQRQKIPLDSSAKKFCQSAKPAAPDIIQIYRVLGRQWGDLTELDQENEYKAITTAKFSEFYDENSEEPLRDQIKHFKEDLENRTEKLEVFFPTPASREVVVYNRLTNGMTNAFAQVCRDCRNDAKIKKPDQALDRLQDRATELATSGKTEKNSSPVYFTEEDVAEIRRKEREAGKKQGKKQGKKAAENSFYANPKPFGSKGKGGGKGQKGAKGKWKQHGAGRRDQYDQAPWAYARGGGGKGRGKYGEVFECSYCGEKFHKSEFCRKRKADEAAARDKKDSDGGDRYMPDGRKIVRR
jgi:hypothetical protein